MKTSIKKNYFYNLSYQILNIFLPIITTPYIARVLGAENIGIYNYTISITTYFILFGSLGVAMYGQREIAYSQNDVHLRSKTFFEIVIMRFITLGISLILFYLCFVSKGEYEIYYKILILSILGNCFDISWFFQGLEEFKKTVTKNLIIRIIGIISIFTFIKTEENLLQYFWISVILDFLGYLSLWLYLPKFLTKIKLKDLKIFQHLKPIIDLFIPQIAIQLYTVFDKTMIGNIIDNKSEVAFYSQAQQILKLLLTIATSFGTVMVPRMANTFANGDNFKLKEYINKSFRFILLLVFPMMFGIITVSDKFVPIFFGSGYDKVAYLIILMSPILLAIAFSGVIGTQYLLTTKQQKKLMISVVIGASVNFCLNMIFIRLWSSIGAVIATVIAEFTVTGVQFYLVREEIKISEVLKIINNYFVASIIITIVSYIIGLIISNNLLSIFIQICVSIIIYFIILIILKDSMVMEILNIIKDVIKGAIKDEKCRRK